MKRKEREIEKKRKKWMDGWFWMCGGHTQTHTEIVTNKNLQKQMFYGISSCFLDEKALIVWIEILKIGFI